MQPQPTPKMLRSDERGASSSGSNRCRYDVFLSFRGEDTRKKFTDHLYTALAQAGFHTFRDDDEIERAEDVRREIDDEVERGEDVQREIQIRIREAKLSLVVFSGDYASSVWCLDKLVLIMDQRRTRRHHVIPVFYGVDPSDVSEQTGVYAEAFVRHEIRFKDDADKVRNWRKALGEVADLGGMVLGNRHEAVFIQDIVRETRKKLDKPVLFVTPYLVGRHNLINEINLWIQHGMSDVSIATIYGIGGVGKTTVANIVYNSNYDKFDASSFLANVREASKEVKDLIQLQQQLLSDLLKQKDIRIRNIDEGIMKIKDAICCRRILIVLDDLGDLYQFSTLIGMREWLSHGSKIIITTRREHLLRTHDVCRKFLVSGLGSDEALELLSWHAFGQDHPVEGFVECSKAIVKHCDGLPLALKVLGSSLTGENIKVWAIALKNLEMFLDKVVHKALRISYDSLKDDHDKELFLHIACFFIGKDKDYAAAILEGCGFYADIGISNLISRCLLYVDGCNYLRMQQLLRDMGRELVRQESPNPGKRSRLWHDNDAFKVLRDKIGTETITGLSLDLRRLKQVRHEEATKNEEPSKRSYKESFDSSSSFCERNCSKRQRLGFCAWKSSSSASRIDENVLEAHSLGRMPRLKLLQLKCVEFNGNYGEFPKGLVWLSWNGFPMESIPANLSLEKLVALEICHSNLKDTWKRGKVLGNLKILDFSHCHGLVRSPDFTGLPYLERLLLKYCTNLKGLDKTIACLQNLLLLDLEGCKNLQTIPKEIGSLESLEKLILSGCLNLKYLPQELGKLTSLTSLNLEGISMGLSESASRGIQQIGVLRPLSWMSILRSMFFSTSPRSCNFPSASLPCSLVDLKLANCNLSDDILSTEFPDMPFLERLNLSGNPIHILPEKVCVLSRLNSLVLNGCPKLQTLRQLPKSLEYLGVSNCLSLEVIRFFSSSPPSLLIKAQGCPKLVEIQGILKLKDITSTDIKIISKIGLFNLESIRGTEIEMLSDFTDTKRKVPLQVLHEGGISSIFLPEAGSPSWYTYHDTGLSACFDVPPHADRTMRGLNICFELQENTNPEIEIANNAEGKTRALPQRRFPAIKILNHTTGKTWKYHPSFYCLPAPGKTMLWLSHWRFDNGLEVGDYVVVSLRSYQKELVVKHTYVDPVYEAEEERELTPIHDDISPWRETVPGCITRVTERSKVMIPSGTRHIGVRTIFTYCVRLGNPYWTAKYK